MKMKKYLQKMKVALLDNLSNYQANQQYEYEFDSIVGCLEEILISEEFEEIQNEFIKEKCKEFTS